MNLFLINVDKTPKWQKRSLKFRFISLLYVVSSEFQRRLRELFFFWVWVLLAIISWLRAVTKWSFLKAYTKFKALFSFKINFLTNFPSDKYIQRLILKLIIWENLSQEDSHHWALSSRWKKIALVEMSLSPSLP